MTENKKELTKEELQKAAGGVSDAVEDVQKPYIPDDDPSTDDDNPQLWKDKTI